MIVICNVEQIEHLNFLFFKRKLISFCRCDIQIKSDMLMLSLGLGELTHYSLRILFTQTVKK